MNIELKKVSRLSMLIALSVIINILESFIPLNIAPGFKIGLANVVHLFVLYKYSFKDTLYVAIMRIILVGILFSGLFSVSFFLSLGGALLSTVMMFFAKKIKIFSIIGVSIVGAVSHNIGQVLVGMFFINFNILYSLPYLLLFALPMGIVVGFISKTIIERVKILD